MRRVLLSVASAAVGGLVFWGGLQLGRNAPGLHEPYEPESTQDRTHFEPRENPNEMYSFEEPIIEAAVHSTLNIDDGSLITYGDLDDVRGLYIVGKRVLPSNEFFNYYGDRFWKDDEPWGTLENLNDLRHMRNLAEFCVMAQPISDISPLAENSRLRIANPNNCEVSDVTPLLELSGVIITVLTGSPVPDEQFALFQTMPRLEHLSVSHTDLKSIAQLGEMPKLKWLYVNGTLIEDLDGIAGMPNLAARYCSQIQSLSVILQNSSKT